MHHLPTFQALLLCLFAGLWTVSALVEPPEGILPTLAASAATAMPVPRVAGCTIPVGLKPAP